MANLFFPPNEAAGAAISRGRKVAFLTLTFISSQHRKKWWWGEQHDYTYLSPMMVEGSVYSARKRKTPLPFRIAALGPTI